jgi:hypothetical protein
MGPYTGPRKLILPQLSYSGRSGLLGIDQTMSSVVCLRIVLRSVCNLDEIQVYRLLAGV